MSKPLFDIKHLVIENHLNANLLDEYLQKGWKINPFERIEKTDNFMIYPLIYIYDDKLDLKTLNPHLVLPEDPEKPKKSEFEDVIAMIDCTHDSVEGLVKQGYKVHTIYQKNVIMIKRKE